MDKDEEDWPLWEVDKVVQAAGGLVDPGYLDDYHRMACGWVRSVYREALERLAESPFADRLVPISLVFIENPEANALAIDRNTRKSVAIYLGTIHRLWALWTAALTSPSFLKGAFDSPAPTPFSAAETLDLASMAWRKDLPADWPEDRKAGHADLFHRSVEVLIYHELAHHLRGHLDLCRRPDGLSVVSEALKFQKVDDNSFDDSQLMEFDADHHALDLMLIAADRDGTFWKLEAEPAKTEFFRFGLAILAVFQLFDHEHRPNAVHYASSHPAPVHRAMRMLHALSRTFAREFGWSEDERVEEHDFVWEVASDLAALLNMPAGRWRGGSTQDMDHERYRKYDAAFVEFAKRLDDINADDA